VVPIEEKDIETSAKLPTQFPRIHPIEMR
jgi:hypothetical protein